MIKRLFSILLPAAFVAAGCSQLEEPVGEQSVTSETSLLTKCVNSAANAQEGTLQTDDELSQRYGLYRWYQLHFPSDTGVASAAEDMAKLSSVTAIQFNTTYERRFRSDAPIEWKPFAGRGYGEFNLPFNDPMLVDQWHYSGVESGVEIDIYLGLSSDYTFDLYQKVGEGPHYLYKGKYKFDGEVITGTYSDYTPWAHDYKVSGSGNSLVLTSVAVQAIQ